MNPLLSIILGVVVLLVIGITFGGHFLLSAGGDTDEFTPLQKRYFRAGHAHAGVLATLGLVAAVLQTQAGVGGGWEFASLGVASSAILIPAGFFLSVLGRKVETPGPPARLIIVGMVVLCASLVVVGVSVIGAGVGAP